MTDKEVGELWKQELTYYHDSYIIRLIRKLVEERANNKRLQRRCEEAGVYFGGPRINQGPLNEDAQALRDFGIDPKTWLKD